MLVLGWAAVVVPVPVRGGDVAPQESAAKILSESGVRGGLVVQLGVGDGRLTAALRANGRYVVQGLDTDAARVAAARRYIQSVNRYGPVSVNQYDGHSLPYADNLVRLLVAEESAGVSRAEMVRVLSPDGVAYIQKEGRWERQAKPWPPEIDEWTHWLHAADGNAVASDRVAGPPRRLQWIARPFWSRHHNTVPSVSAMVSAAGRLFYIVDEAPSSMDGSAPDKWVLVARDAFSGLLLWRKPMPDWGWRAWSAEWTCRFTVPTNLPRRLVAAGDRVYVTLGFNAPLTELDAATGRVLRTFPQTQYTDEILYDRGKLIIALNKGPQKPSKSGDQRRGGSAEPAVRKWVAVIDVTGGKMLWKKGDYEGLRSKTGSMDRINHLSMCVGQNQVFFVDRDHLISLDLHDGHEVWRAPRPQVPEHRMRYNIRITDMCTLMCHDDNVYFVQLNPDRVIDWREIRGRLHVYRAETGEEIWDHPCASWGWAHPADVFAIDGLVWIFDYEEQTRKAREQRPRSAADLASGTSWVDTRNTFVVGLDPKTGAVKRRVSCFRAFDNGHHHRCYRNKATSRFLMTNFRGLEFMDWSENDSYLQHWVRGTCRLGPIPCNGLVYATPHPCDCYITSKLNGVLALAPAAGASSTSPSRAIEATVGQRSRLQYGPAYGLEQTADVTAPATDRWTTYRHDFQRTGTTSAKLPGKLRLLWSTSTGGRPTSCVIGGNRVVLADAGRYQVLAMDPTSGQTVWEFTTGGPVDTPPTISGERAYFGCSDGWVYCLGLQDGRLVWRFRGAPRDYQVGAFGRIESAWPIHGSVVVRDGVVYFTAGRSSFLDGGIVAATLDAKTGRLLSERRITNSYSTTVDWGRSQTADSGLLSDVLVSDGPSIYMRQQCLFPAESPSGQNSVLRSTAGLLDDTWFSRTRWLLGGKAYAEYFVFDAETVYGVMARSGMNVNSGFFTPARQGYELAAMTRVVKKGSSSTANKQGRTRKRTSGKRWSIHLPVRVTSMVLAGDTLFAAGTPDILDAADPWAAYEGRRGGVMVALSSADGRELARYELPSPPVLDGLVAAAGRLFVSTADGKVRCYGTSH